MICLYWKWFRLLIDGYRKGELPRERFISGWKKAQGNLAGL